MKSFDFFIGFICIIFMFAICLLVMLPIQFHICVCFCCKKTYNNNNSNPNYIDCLVIHFRSLAFDYIISLYFSLTLSDFDLLSLKTYSIS